MAEKGLVNKSTLEDIADSIRAKLESADTMLPSEMAGLIESIATGYEVVTGEIQTGHANSISVTHGLGRTPVLAVLFMALHKSDTSYTTVDRSMQANAYHINGVSNGTYYNDTTSNTYAAFGGGVTMGDTTVVFNSKDSSHQFYDSSYGFKYIYVIAG